MKTVLDVLFENHKLWLNYMESFKCKKDLQEDFVQEMYIRIFDYIQRTDNDIMYNETEINFYFVYVTLKNLYGDYLRKLNKNPLVELVDFEFNLEVNYNKEFIFERQTEAVNKWVEELNFELNKVSDFTIEKSNLSYINFIFEQAFLKNKSISELSRETNITYWSLRNTVLNIKKQIKEL